MRGSGGRSISEERPAGLGVGKKRVGKVGKGWQGGWGGAFYGRAEHCLALVGVRTHGARRRRVIPRWSWFCAFYTTAAFYIKLGHRLPTLVQLLSREVLLQG